MYKTEQSRKNIMAVIIGLCLGYSLELLLENNIFGYIIVPINLYNAYNLCTDKLNFK